MKTTHLLRPTTLALAVALAALAGAVRPALGQQPAADGMERTGTVTTRSDKERALFASLNCTCGTCPKESLSTCTCGFAHARREELRAALASGRSVEQVRAAFAERWGMDALAVPPNQGANRALYLVPLAAVLGCGAVLTLALRRWRRKSDEKAGQAGAAGATTNGAVAAGKRDDYDDKLDQELDELDRS